MYRSIKNYDPDIYKFIRLEKERQNRFLELIASENFASPRVLAAMATPLNNKYAEGYPYKRYYGGCEYVDEIESICIDRVKKLFGAEHANVQPHSGTSANMAVYFAFLKPGDKLMGMDLTSGGHLSHGHPVSSSGRDFDVIRYGVSRENELLDYDEIFSIAEREKPKIIICGASAYPRFIDFKKFREIADSVGAILMADVAHTAGLIAAGIHPSPVPYCDVVTFTTHKTMRGPRGGIILCKEQYAKKIDKAVFPGVQGGPFMHVIAAKAIAFKEALDPSFTEYQKQVVKNCKELANELQKEGFRLVSGGTDIHLAQIDVKVKGLTGKLAEEILEEAGITVNKNTIPFDTEKPFIASGIRIGTPAVTTRGMKEKEMRKIAQFMIEVLANPDSEEIRYAIRKEVEDMCSAFPIYSDLLS